MSLSDSACMRVCVGLNVLDRFWVDMLLLLPVEPMVWGSFLYQACLLAKPWLAMHSCHVT